MYWYIGYYYLLILSSLTYGAMTVRRRSPLSYRLLLWWLIATVPTEVMASVMARVYHNNLCVYNIWEPFDCCMVLLMFYFGIVHKTTRRMFRWLLVLVPAGFVLFNLWHFIALAWHIRSMLFYLFCELIGACLFLIDGLLPGEEQAIFQRSFVWMAFGTILYCIIYILTHALWEYIQVWPTWIYEVLVGIANTFDYLGVWLALYALRKRPGR
ncbi:MAG TPA: hypothetical protein VHC96_03500 [Puia sp.]|nr:hypothetical protein [Puia sp.]